MADWRVWAIGSGLIVLLGAGGLWFWRRRRRRSRLKVQQRPVIAGQAGAAELTGTEGDASPALASGSQRAISQGAEALTQTARIETLVEELRKNIDEDPVLAASVLRSWIEETQA